MVFTQVGGCASLWAVDTVACLVLLGFRGHKKAEVPHLLHMSTKSEK